MLVTGFPMTIHLDAHPRPTSMDNVWAGLPVEAGMLAPAIAHLVHLDAPIQLVDASRAQAPPVAPSPHRETFVWNALKSAVQSMVAVTAIVFVVSGDQAPALALSSAITCLLLMGVIVIADRQRFLDRDPGFEIVDLIAPVMAEIAPVPVLSSPLGPLAEHMAMAMPGRIDVT